MHQAVRAIILAAGIGERLYPITAKTPKPLIEVGGKKLIETIIEGLIHNGIYEIYVVTGHLADQFEYLPKKYGNCSLRLIFSPHYDTYNNIASLYTVREHLGDSIVIDGDHYIRNPQILRPHFHCSGYSGSWVESTTDWLLQTDAEGFVYSCSRTGGKSGWLLSAISFWTATDGAKLSIHLEELFMRKKITDIFWDDIPLFYCKDDYRLKVREIHSSDVAEIDNHMDLSKLADEIEGNK